MVVCDLTWHVDLYQLPLHHCRPCTFFLFEKFYPAMNEHHRKRGPFGHYYYVSYKWTGLSLISFDLWFWKPGHTQRSFLAGILIWLKVNELDLFPPLVPYGGKLLWQKSILKEKSINTGQIWEVVLMLVMKSKRKIQFISSKVTISSQLLFSSTWIYCKSWRGWEEVLTYSPSATYWSGTTFSKFSLLGKREVPQKKLWYLW